MHGEIKSNVHFKLHLLFIDIEFALKVIRSYETIYLYFASNFHGLATKGAIPVQLQVPRKNNHLRN